MKNVSLAEKYALTAVLLLAILVLVNRPFVTIAGAAIGIAGGIWVARRGKLSRAAILAVVAFVLALGFAVVALLR